jgi:hypothetical protein
MFDIQLNEQQSFNIGGKISEDQWTYAWYATNSTALGNVAVTSGIKINLVDIGYLPNDGYDYEILISMYGWTLTTSGNAFYLWVYGASSKDDTKMRVSLCGVNTRTSSSVGSGPSCRFPLLNGNRDLFIYNSSTATATNSWGIALSGYRRLGINN